MEHKGDGTQHKIKILVGSKKQMEVDVSAGDSILSLKKKYFSEEIRCEITTILMIYCFYFAALAKKFVLCLFP